ncbi:hypothetical protein [Emticicia sp. TH156]|uniref:hypothetical protein n=1 Tax=Emticicia sp. TH156 TaxID=2067454 RepID=UPI0013040860|nr:hypothetical protein [Emticicia sp. TH156]
MKTEHPPKKNNKATAKEKKKWIVPKMKILAVNNGNIWPSSVENYAYFVNS